MNTEHAFVIPYKLFRGAKVPLSADEERLEAAASFVPKQNDVLINTYPKCGTTWVQHIVYLIMNDGDPATDVTKVLHKIPFPEQDGFSGDDFLALKYHLPHDLVPSSDSAKYIVIVRNPMDACVSYYHFLNGIPNYDIPDFDYFFEAFINGQLPYGDYFDYVVDWYEHRNDRNVLFLTYEDMKENHETAVRDITKFLDRSSSLREPRFITDVIRYSSISYMRSIIDGTDILSSYLKVHQKSYEKGTEISTTDRKGPSMIRKGCVGDWKNHFSHEQERRMRRKMEDRLKHTSLLCKWNKL